MEKYFGKNAFYESESPYISGMSRTTKKRESTGFRNTYGTHAYGKIMDPLEAVRNDFAQARAKLTEELLMDLKRKYLAVKLRKIMAVEVLKNRVAGDLKQVVQRMNVQALKGANSKEFIILGGGPRSLNYSTQPRSLNKSKSKGLSKPLAIEVDVRGYIPDNVFVDTEDNRMSIRAVRVNGIEKALGIVAPSTSAMEKVKVHRPKDGVLLLLYKPKGSGRKGSAGSVSGGGVDKTKKKTKPVSVSKRKISRGSLNRI